jgi:O-antigen/teichoic acid export membrane protein
MGAVGTAVVGKGSVFVVNAISVPILVRYLGPEEYGLWVTISMTIAMLVVLDVGIASTLTNLISEAYAHDDRESAGHYFSTAFWMTAAVALVLGAAGWLVWPHIDFAYLLNLKDPALTPEVSRATMAAAALFLCGLPAGLAARALAGYQELHFANLFSAGGNVLALGAIVLVVALHGSLAVLVGAYAGAIVLGSVACLGWMCAVRKPWLRPWPGRVRVRLASRIFTSGGQFFLMQLAGLVVFNSDNLVIAHFLTPAQVTPYSVTWRLVSYITAAQVLLFPAMWPAYSEAWTRGDLGWIRRAYGRLERLTALTLAGGGVVLLFFGERVIRIWAGPAAVPTPGLLRLMCVWMVIFAVTTNQACLMAATNRIRRQAIAAALSAAANLALTLYWVRTLGLIGVLLGTVVSYVMFVLGVQMWEVHRILNPGEKRVPALDAQGKA